MSTPGAGMLEVTIESLAAGGEGVGRDARGRVVFVPFAAPGDRLRVRVLEEQSRFARGEIDAVLAPGADRVTPRCQVFGTCGGCAWQHIDYATQLEAKRAMLRDALERIGGIAVPPIEVIASPQPYGYRGRARVLVEGGRVGFRKRRSHEVCAIHACPLLAPPLDAALADLAAHAPARDGEWELALGSDGAVRATALADRAPSADRIAVHAAGERIEVSSGVFVQANALLQGALAQTVLDAAGQGGEALELFAGAGFFTLGLARRFARVAAVESDAAAVVDLARNCAEAGLPQVRVIEAPAEAVLAALRRHRLAPDVVVLDPPRGGIGTRASEQLARLPAQRIVHVSCDPATLARDLRVLTQKRWSLVRVVGFDLFPQTPHVEAVAVLTRAGANPSS
jgi:23S rRNA (uracil1939-C5)-methyltransferase